MSDALRNNPAIATGIARAVVTVIIMLGLTLSSEQEAAIVVVVQLAFSFVTSKLTVPKSPTVDAPAASIQTPAPPQ